MTIEEYTSDKFNVRLYNQTKEQIEMSNGPFSLLITFEYGNNSFSEIQNKISSMDIDEQLNFFKDFKIILTEPQITVKFDY